MRQTEELLGMKAARKRILLGDNEPHDETFSYGLCQRFYSDKDRLRAAAEIANSEIRQMIGRASGKQLADAFALVGNIYYLLEDYGQAAGYFMKAITYDREDITCWIEFLFCLRAMGEFELFEKGIFNIGQLYNNWKANPQTQMDQDTLSGMIGAL